MPEPSLTFTRLAGSEDAPLLVVGPSLGTSVEALWDAAARRLGDRVEVVGWDLPGHGRSKPATEPFTVAELAAVVRRTAADLAGRVETTPRPAFYAGVSIAGAVALQLALDPGPFTTTVCVAGTAKSGEPESWHERAAFVRKAGTPAMVEGSTARWFAPGFLDRDPATANRLLLSLSDADDESYALCCEALARHDLWPRLGDARVPVLLLPGEHDVVVPPDAAQGVADAIPGATLEVAAGTAHLPPAEDPAGVADILLAHLTEAADA